MLHYQPKEDDKRNTLLLLVHPFGDVYRRGPYSPLSNSDLKYLYKLNQKIGEAIQNNWYILVLGEPLNEDYEIELNDPRAFNVELSYDLYFMKSREAPLILYVVT